MSTYFRSQEKIKFSDIFDGRLERFDIREHATKETMETFRCLTDGRNFLWLYGDADGMLNHMSRYGANAVGKMLRALAEAFGTEIYSEYEPQYWGFENQEQWDLAAAESYEQSQMELHASILAYVKGEANDLSPNTNGMTMANIAKDLIAATPHLILAENRAELMEAINRIFSADHLVTINVSESDIALATLAVTQEDDLPQA